MHFQFLVNVTNCVPPILLELLALQIFGEGYNIVNVPCYAILLLRAKQPPQRSVLNLPS
jgi:hypothetical protein